jgi:hypothetical protein
MFTKSLIRHMGGVPVLGSAPFITGNVYFVHRTGSDGYEGTYDRPFASLDFALSKCTADHDDLIILKAGHYETITGAGGITADIAGVTILGLGNYDARPYFLMDGAATVSALVTAANVTFKNIVFKAGHADINYCFLITAKGCTIDSCCFVENIATENFVDVIHAGVADNDYDGLVLNNNEFVMNDAACVTAIDLLKNSLDVKILNNRITGDFDATPYAPIYSGADEIHYNILVQGNLIHNAHNDNAAVGISIANTASTGWIVYNHVGHADAAGETPILAGAAGLYVGENYASGVRGTASGYLYPAVDS